MRLSAAPLLVVATLEVKLFALVDLYKALSGGWDPTVVATSEE